MKRLTNLTISALVALATLCACEKTNDVTEEISASPESVTFAAAGETKNIAVTTNVDDWTYSGQPDWVTVVADGKSLALTATANPSTTEGRTGTLTLTAGEAYFEVDLTQPKGEKYPGYTELSVCNMSYEGSLYQMIIPSCEGGQASLELTSADGRVMLHLEYFTPEYQTLEEVEIPEGTFSKGDSYEAFADLQLSGTPMTFMGGAVYVITDELGEEEFEGGSSITYVSGDVEEKSFIVDGLFSIALNDDGSYLIKTDLKDKDGNDIKYYYEGDVEFDAEDAVFPVTGDIDPTDIESVLCTYNGDSGYGTTYLSLTMYATTGAMTSIDFYVPTTSFEELNITGNWYAPEGENTGAAGTLDKGSLMEMEGFAFPMGSFIMMTFGDYFIADGQSSMMIIKDEGAETYTIMANLQSTDETREGYLFMVEGASVEIIDGTSYEDEEW